MHSQNMNIFDKVATLVFAVVITVPSAQTWITLTYWYHDDVYKCASMCRWMQGRLLVVLLRTDHFIKTCVCLHVYVLVSTNWDTLVHTCTISTVTLPTCVHTYTQTNTHTLSQQKQELGDTINEPKCYSSIKLRMDTEPRDSSQDCSSYMTAESFSSSKLSFFLSFTHSASLLFLLHHTSILSAVKSHCLSFFFSFFFSPIPFRMHGKVWVVASKPNMSGT